MKLQSKRKLFKSKFLASSLAQLDANIIHTVPYQAFLLLDFSIKGYIALLSLLESAEAKKTLVEFF